MNSLSHGVFLPDETVSLSPLAICVQEPRQGYNFSKSAVRALDILELFARVDRPLRAIDVTRLLGISPSSTIQLLKTMMDCAYLVFDPVTKSYFPSPRLAEFGGWLSSKYFGDHKIQRLLSSVQAITGEVVVLSTCQGSFMQVLDVRQPGAPLQRTAEGMREPRQIPKGLRSPLFGSASGVVWLAAHDDDGVTLAAITRCHRELGRFANDPELILNGIHRVRERGYVCGGYSHDDRVWAVTMALPPSEAGIVTVLGVVGPAERISADREQLVALCRKEIAEHLAA